MKLLLPVLSGVLVALSFPRHGLGCAAWVAYVPLIAFVFLSATSPRAFWGGFVAGFIAAFSLLLWIPEVLIRYGGMSPALASAAYTSMAVALACFPAAACALAKYAMRRGGSAFFLLLPFFWVVFEYALSLFPFGGLPWILAGYSQSGYGPVLQIADVTGIYGVSFLILASGTALVWLVCSRGSRKAAWAPVLAAVLLTGGALAYGRRSLEKWNAVPAAFRVAMLQGNISADDPESAVAAMFRTGYVRMADTLQPGEADLLVLPESPSPASFEVDDAYRRTFEALSGRYAFGLIYNGIRYEETPQGSEYFNSAVFLGRGGAPTAVYDKIHLVPFGEYIPLARILSFAETITRDAGHFSPGRDIRVADLGGHPANAVICFEAVFPDLVRRFVRKGSRLIVNLTNDAWYGDSAAPYQHLAIARVRAVENRRYLLRATNSGISAIVEPSGRIQTATGLFREDVCRGSFGFVEAQTFYTRYGDVFVFLCAIIAFACWLMAECRRAAFRKRQLPEG